MVNDKSKVELPNQYWNFILQAISHLPYNQSAPIIKELEKQIMTQKVQNGDK